MENQEEVKTEEGKKPTWKKWWFWAILIIIAIFIFSAGGDNEDVAEEEVETSRETSERESIINELIDKYQAVRAFEQRYTMYTIEAQERFVVNSPIIFEARVIDIFSENNKYYIRFAPSRLSLIALSGFNLKLECDRSYVDQILEKEPSDSSIMDEYVVVANIKEVFRPVFAIKGTSAYEDEVEIDINPSKLLIIKGECVEIVYSPNDFMERLRRDVLDKH